MLDGEFSLQAEESFIHRLSCISLLLPAVATEAYTHLSLHACFQSRLTIVLQVFHQNIHTDVCYQSFKYAWYHQCLSNEHTCISRFQDHLSVEQHLEPKRVVKTSLGGTPLKKGLRGTPV